MNLLHKILSYSNDTKQIRNQRIAKLNSLKENLEQNLRHIDQEIATLNNELASCSEKVTNCKKDIKARLTLDCQQKAYDLLASEIKTFGTSDAFIVGRYVADSLDELKSRLLKLEKRIKEIKDVLIPNYKKQKQDHENDYKKKVSMVDAETIRQLDDIRKPLMSELNMTAKHCAVNYQETPSPQRNDLLPEIITIGNYLVKSNSELKEISPSDPILVPFDIDARNHGNIILKIDSNQLYDYDQQIEKIIAGLTMRYMESFPSGHLKLGIYSSSITSFGRLSAIFTASVKGKISITQETCKTREQFAKLLLSISEKGEMVNAKLLENNCVDLYDLYEQDIKTEDFQLVIIHDAFKEMTLDNINQLHGCISELSKCGIRFVIIDDFNDEIYKNKPAAFMSKLNQILECGTVFTIASGRVRDTEGNNVALISSADVTTQGIYSFVNQYCEFASENKAPYLSYEKVGFGKCESDKTNFESIVIPVALNAPDIWNIEFDVTGSSPNANLIVGIPGTGKSTLIDSLIMNGSMKYSPDELNFQLLDFKDGISSSVYTMEDCKIPHVKVVSQNNKPEEAEIILSNILAESERRNKEFMSLREETSEAIRNIVEYNQLVATGKYGRKNMPRLIIVIDECQYLFDDEALAKKCQDIVRKCRSQGIHLILATQTLSHKMWSTVKFVEGIYCFEIAKDDAEQLLNKKYVPLITTEIPKGSYMAFASNNSGHDCEKIKIAFDGGNTARYSLKIRDKWSDFTIDLVVVGDKSANFVSKTEYDVLLADYSNVEIPIGENYNDHRTMSISFYKRRPLFLVGTNQKVADSILQLVSYVALKKEIDTYVIDASTDQNPKKFIEKQNHEHIVLGDESNYLEILHKIYEMYKARETNLRAEHPPVFFIVNALQNIVDFLNNKELKTSTQSIESDEDVDQSKLSIKEIIALNRSKQNAQSVSLSVNGKETLIPYLLSNAYKVNIFICISLNTASLINDSGEQVFGYFHRNIIKTCDYKILYPNCSSDIRNVMDEAFKEKMLNGLNENMAFMSLEQREFYKFRYYQLEDEV